MQQIRVGSEPDTKKLVAFADQLAASIMKKAKSMEPSQEIAVRPQDDVSGISNISSRVGVHTELYLRRWAKEGTCTSTSTRANQHVGTQARCVWCSRVNGRKNVKTQLKCVECKFGFCSPSTGRDCWKKHIEYGGVPPRETSNKRSRLT